MHVCFQLLALCQCHFHQLPLFLCKFQLIPFRPHWGIVDLLDLDGVGVFALEYFVLDVMLQLVGSFSISTYSLSSVRVQPFLVWRNGIPVWPLNRIRSRWPRRNNEDGKPGVVVIVCGAKHGGKLAFGWLRSSVAVVKLGQAVSMISKRLIVCVGAHLDMAFGHYLEQPLQTIVVVHE